MDKFHEKKLLTEHQAAKYLGLKPKTLRNWRWMGIGPAFVRLSPRSIRYRQCDLDIFVERYIRHSTSDDPVNIQLGNEIIVCPASSQDRTAAIE